MAGKPSAGGRNTPCIETKIGEQLSPITMFNKPIGEAEPEHRTGFPEPARCPGVVDSLDNC